MKIEIGYSSILKVVGWLLLVEGGLLLIPLVMALCLGEGAWSAFAVAAGGSALTGALLTRRFRYTSTVLHRREGYMLVSLVWIVFSLFGMIPYIMSSCHLSVSDAFFETISGFTTTGATTIADVESCEKSVLFWRAFTQWIGGLGIILFMLAILPSLNRDGGIPMFNAETTGITHDKLHPRIQRTALTLWGVYCTLSVALILLLWAGPMNFYESVCQGFAGISTGGFSTRNASMAAWHSPYLSLVMTVFMFSGGVNFTLLYMAAKGNVRQLLRNDVFKAYVLIVATCFALYALVRWFGTGARDWVSVIVEPVFHVVSTITTTGFSLGDFAAWGPLALMLTYLLMFSGGCAGSTSGAIKVDRLVAMRKNLANEIKKTLYPHRTLVTKVNGNVVSAPEMSHIMAFITLYMLTILAGTLMLTAFGVNMDDSLFAVISCVGNNGLGYGLTGSAGGYHMLPDSSKWVLSILMLAGRLELFSILVMLAPSFWRK